MWPYVPISKADSQAESSAPMQGTLSGLEGYTLPLGGSGSGLPAPWALPLAPLPARPSHDALQDTYDSSAVGGSFRSSSLLGLPPGTKPPPLTMVNSITRTTATVTPLNQPSPSNSITSMSTNGTNSALNATRASSFAAALRKLAKQAGDTEPGALVPPHEGARETSPASVPTNLSTSPRDQAAAQSASSKRGLAPPMPYGSAQSGVRISSPPVVTIAPTPSSHHSYLDSRKNLDRPGTASSGHSSSMLDPPPPIKQEHDKVVPSGDRREEERPHSKDGATAGTPRITPHSVMSSTVPTSLASSYEELTSRGFQPYRPGEDPRLPTFPTSAPYPSLDPALYSAYHSAFAAQSPFSHPAFRFDDPMLLERYRMMQQPLFPYAHPGMLQASHPGLHALLPPGVRYPPELLAQSQLHLFSGSKLPDHLSPGTADRSKAEEEMRREREKEAELEREREREREREAQRERERQREKEERERQERERRERERREKERERERAERERQRQAEREHRSPTGGLKQEDPGGGRYGGPRDPSIFSSAEKLVGAGPYPYPIGAGINSHKDTDMHSARLDKERERQYMHQQFLREQDMLLREQGRRSLQEKPDANGPTHSSVALSIPKVSSSEHSSHHTKPTTTDPKAMHFHRPFEKSMPNGYEKDHLREYEQRLHSQEANKVLPNDSRYLAYHRPQHHSESRTVANNVHPDSDAVGKMSRHHHHHHHHHHSPGHQSRHRHHSETGSNTHSSRHDNHSSPQGRDGTHSEFTYRLNSYKGSKVSEADQAAFKSAADAKSRPPISKLDMEEDKHKAARHSGYHSDEGSDLERLEVAAQGRPDNKKRLLVISSGPMSKRDKSPNKMPFLGNFGLATQEQKSGGDPDLCYDQRAKRRRLYRETSVSPVELEEQSAAERTEGWLRSNQLSVSSEELTRTPDYKYRARFLHSLGLEPVPPQRRRELDFINKVCEWDRQKRNGMKDAPLPFPVLENHLSGAYLRGLPHPSRPQHNLLLGSGKRKHSESEPGQDSQPLPPSASLASRTHRHHGYKTEGGDREASRPRALSKEFAQEFHESVLQATRQQQESRAGSLTRDDPDNRHANIKSSTSLLAPAYSATKGPLSTSSSESHQYVKSERVDNSEAFRWPGIEALLEAYQRHVDEQKLEKQVLREQCSRLQTSNRELNHSAERLSRRMADLLQNKQHLEEDRYRTQQALDNLKKSLQTSR